MWHFKKSSRTRFQSTTVPFGWMEAQRWQISFSLSLSPSLTLSIFVLIFNLKEEVSHMESYFGGPDSCECGSFHFIKLFSHWPFQCVKSLAVALLKDSPDRKFEKWFGKSFYFHHFFLSFELFLSSLSLSLEMCFCVFWFAFRSEEFSQTERISMVSSFLVSLFLGRHAPIDPSGKEEKQSLSWL